MTTRVLLITEDPTRDPYIAMPVLTRIFSDLLIPAKIEPLRDPHIRGVAEAIHPDTINKVIRANKMISLFILLCDRDCDRQGNVAKAAARELEHRDKLITCLAMEELEVWMLALHRENLSIKWSAVRSHCDPKEAFAEPFLKEKGWVGRFGQGYAKAMTDLGSCWTGLLAVCPEIADLKSAIMRWDENKRARA